MPDNTLSDPITLRLPLDVLAEIERIGEITGRKRSWVFVRALKAYLAAEGQDILQIDQARRDIDDEQGHDLDDVIDAVDAIVRHTAA